MLLYLIGDSLRVVPAMKDCESARCGSCTHDWIRDEKEMTVTDSERLDGVASPSGV
jgi:hypothetical protein